MSEDDARRRGYERLHRKQSHALELMALGLPLAETLTAICAFLEERFPGALVAILVRERNALGDWLRVGAAPRLPADYVAAVDGASVNENRIACASAVQRGDVVILADLAAAPLPPEAVPLRDLAVRCGLRACWSQPIQSVEDETLGTVAVVFTTPRGPSDEERRWLREATFLPRIAIERHQAEERVRRTAALYRRAVDQADGALYHRDLSGDRFFFLGESVRDLTGYGPDELTPSLFRSLVQEVVLHGGMAGLTREQARQQFRQQPGSVWRSDYRILRRDGQERWLSDAALHLDGDVEANGLASSLGLLQDITDRKNAERAASAARQRVQNVLESITDGFILLNRDGDYLYLNPQAERMLHVPHDALVGKNIWDAFPDLHGTVVEQSIRRALDEGTTTEYELYYAPLDTYFEVRCFPASEGLTLYVRDVTEKKGLQAQVIQAAKLAAMGELVAGVTHEINNPLSVIRGSAQMLALSDDAAARTDAEAIVAMTDRIAGLVRSLLSFARRSGFESRPFALNDAVRAAVDLARFRLRESSASLVLELADDLPPVHGSRNQIEQVLVNLLSNAEHAVRARPPARRGIAIDTGLRAGVGAQGPRVWARVTDTGAGVPPEIFPRLFEPFFTTKTEDEGTGLGLSISRGIAHEHGGTLTAENLPDGGGASFTLLLPVDARE